MESNDVFWLKYNFEVFQVLHLSITILCHFVVPLHYISETNIMLFTPLHFYDSSGYKDPYFYIYKASII